MRRLIADAFEEELQAIHAETGIRSPVQQIARCFDCKLCVEFCSFITVLLSSFVFELHISVDKGHLVRKYKTHLPFTRTLWCHGVHVISGVLKFAAE